MKVIWEEADIIPGTKVKVPSCNEIWMIGYDPMQDSSEHYAFISMLDGLIAHKSCRASDMASILNSNGYLPLCLVKGN